MNPDLNGYSPQLQQPQPQLTNNDLIHQIRQQQRKQDNSRIATDQIPQHRSQNQGQDIMPSQSNSNLRNDQLNKGNGVVTNAGYPIDQGEPSHTFQQRPHLNQQQLQTSFNNNSGSVSNHIVNHQQSQSNLPSQLSGRKNIGNLQPQQNASHGVGVNPSKDRQQYPPNGQAGVLNPAFKIKPISTLTVQQQNLANERNSLEGGEGRVSHDPSKQNVIVSSSRNQGNYHRNSIVKQYPSGTIMVENLSSYQTPVLQKQATQAHQRIQDNEELGNGGSIIGVPHLSLPDMHRSQKSAGLTSMQIDPELDKLGIEVQSYGKMVEEIESQVAADYSQHNSSNQSGKRKSKRSDRLPPQSHRAPSIPHIGQLFVEGSLKAQHKHRKDKKEKEMSRRNSKAIHVNTMQTLDKQNTLQPPQKLTNKLKSAQFQNGQNDDVITFNNDMMDIDSRHSKGGAGGFGKQSTQRRIDQIHDDSYYFRDPSKQSFKPLSSASRNSPHKPPQSQEEQQQEIVHFSPDNGRLGAGERNNGLIPTAGTDHSLDDDQYEEDYNTERKLMSGRRKDEETHYSLPQFLGYTTNQVTPLNQSDHGGGSCSAKNSSSNIVVGGKKTVQIHPLPSSHIVTPDGDYGFSNSYIDQQQFNNAFSEADSSGGHHGQMQEPYTQTAGEEGDELVSKKVKKRRKSTESNKSNDYNKPLHQVDEDSESQSYEDIGGTSKSNSQLKRQVPVHEKEALKRFKQQKYLESQRLRNLKKYNYFVILPDDPIKQKWDLLITFMLLFTALVSPYRIAFVDYDSQIWVVVETITDCIFGLDLILNFFFAFYDQQDEVVDTRSKIAMTYLKGWFTIDVLTILPIAQILNTADYGNLARIARLPKLYRLVKVLRLMRILKVVKERQMLIKYVNEVFRLNAGFERLIFFVLISCVLCHICCCFWVILANLSSDSDDYVDTWLFRMNYINEDDSVIYIASMYFVVTTFTTVGFGDINGVTVPERLFCLLLMLVGAVAFSFSISSLSSMLQALDTRSAQLRERLATLNSIKRQYKLSFDLYRRLRSALKYDYSRNSVQQFAILNELPQNLKIELALLMNKEIIKKVFFFKSKPPYFIAFIGPLLKPLRIEAGNYIYREGDPIEEVFFLTKGKAAFVSKQLDDLPYLTIEAGYYFGEIDFLYQSYVQKRAKLEDSEASGTGGALKRVFTVKAIENCDMLTLNKADLARVEAEFEDIVAEMFVGAHKKIKKTLRIKDQQENQYLKKQISLQHKKGLSNEDDQSDKPELPPINQVRRMASSLYGQTNEGGENADPNKAALIPINEEDEDNDSASDEIKTDSTFEDVGEDVKPPGDLQNDGRTSVSINAYSRNQTGDHQPYREETKKSTSRIPRDPFANPFVHQDKQTINLSSEDESAIPVLRNIDQKRSKGFKSQPSLNVESCQTSSYLVEDDDHTVRNGFQQLQVPGVINTDLLQLDQQQTSSDNQKRSTSHTPERESQMAAKGFLSPDFLVPPNRFGNHHYQHDNISPPKPLASINNELTSVALLNYRRTQTIDDKGSAAIPVSEVFGGLGKSAKNLLPPTSPYSLQQYQATTQVPFTRNQNDQWQSRVRAGSEVTGGLRGFAGLGDTEPDMASNILNELLQAVRKMTMMSTEIANQLDGQEIDSTTALSLGEVFNNILRLGYGNGQRDPSQPKVEEGNESTLPLDPRIPQAIQQLLMNSKQAFMPQHMNFLCEQIMNVYFLYQTEKDLLQQNLPPIRKQELLQKKMSIKLMMFMIDFQMFDGVNKRLTRLESTLEEIQQNLRIALHDSPTPTTNQNQQQQNASPLQLQQLSHQNE